MAASVSGILTLLIVLLAGPAAWSLVWWRKRVHPEGAAEKASASDPEVSTSKQNETSREEVSNTAYLLSLLGYAIGIGNLWRFPYLVGKYGGGAFVFAYLCCLFLVAMPAFFMELVMGQYTRKTSLMCFRTIHSRWAGLGYGQAVLLLFCLSYYNMLLVYSLVYTAGSLQTPLPWAADVGSGSYWTGTVLNNFGGDYDGRGLGALQWKLVLGLLVVWIFVFLSLAFGKEVLAKVTWVTVVGPIVMLAVLLCRVLFLEGAADGIKFYIGKFDVEVLSDLDMWAVACGQILFSLSPGFGTAITMSSFSKPNANVFRTCVTVALANSAFSLLGGFAMFSILGNYTHRLNAAGGVLEEATGQWTLTTVKDQARSGAGLAFITIADGMQHFGALSNIMSVLFFMTLFMLGLDSTFAWVETFVCNVQEAIELCVERKPSRTWVLAGVCTSFFLLGLFYCTQVGMELLDVIDHYVSSYYLLFGVAVEAALFTLDFGWRRLVCHIKLATLGNRDTPNGQEVVPAWLWRSVIPTTVPVMSSLLFLNLLHADLAEVYGGYPAWMQRLGWSSLLLCIVTVPIGGLLAWYRDPRSGLPPLQEDEQRLAEAIIRKTKVPGEPSSEVKDVPSSSQEAGTCAV